jgi:polyisoprenyl-teichoic acid--peptidoglycan teichoic acid transferase
VSRRSTARRTWPQRLVLALNVIVAATCFGTAALLATTSDRLGDRQVVTITRSRPAELVAGLSELTGTVPSGDDTEGDPLPQLEIVDGAAQNWLITGIDNGDCVAEGDLPDADIGDRTQLGERTDTIMVIRVDPGNNQAAILSFPRDLWVKLAGTNREGRINTAWQGKDPSRLIQTIEQAFLVPIDHVLSVDFCAFKAIVTAVGGVKVSFDAPVRDRAVGFQIPAAGCYVLGAEESLDYVRSRKYQTQDASGRWVEDPAADLGRISRQQDFIRRTVQRAFNVGARDPRVAWDLLNAAIDYVITDDATTPRGLLSLGQAMRNLDPDQIATYTVEWRSIEVSGNLVLEPRLKTDSMKQILALFRGQALLAEAPDQVAAEVGEDGRPSTTTTVATTSTDPSTDTTLPGVAPEQRQYGVVPVDDPNCR